MPNPKPPKLAEIAQRISAHLKRFERDPKINKNTKADRSGISDYFHAGAFDSGSKIGVRYISYQGHTFLTKADALRYLAMLDAGFVGRHFEAKRTKEWVNANQMTPADAVAVMDLSYIASDHWQCWYVDRHVRLDRFRALIAKEVGDVDKFPPPEHSYLRETDVPDDEDADNWYEPCEATAAGAFPVTLIARYW